MPRLFSLPWGHLPAKMARLICQAYCPVLMPWAKNCARYAGGHQVHRARRHQ